MNRRSFLKWLGAGSAAVVVAPKAIEAVTANVPANECDCALRSFWDGPCTFHAKHPRCSVTCEMYHDHNATYCLVHDVQPKGEYVDYASFSQFAVEESIDKIVSDTAVELGHQAGVLHQKLMRLTYNA